MQNGGKGKPIPCLARRPELQITVSQYRAPDYDLGLPQASLDNARAARVACFTNMRARRATQHNRPRPRCSLGARRPHRAERAHTVVTPARHLHDPTDPHALCAEQLSALECISTGDPWRSSLEHFSSAAHPARSARCHGLPPVAVPLPPSTPGVALPTRSAPHPAVRGLHCTHTAMACPPCVAVVPPPVRATRPLPPAARARTRTATAARAHAAVVRRVAEGAQVPLVRSRGHQARSGGAREEVGLQQLVAPVAGGANK